MSPVSARREAQERLDALDPGRYEARVVEPSPPAVRTAPWFADDPVAATAGGDRTVVSPVTNADLTWDELVATVPGLGSWCADRWLGAWRRLLPVPDPQRFAATRQGWHRVAEHVVSPARHRATGKIGLRFTHGGFGTPFVPAEGDADQQVRIEGAELVVVRDAERREPLTTLRAAASSVGLELDYRSGVYEPATALEPDEPLLVDPAAAGQVADWVGFAASVLEELRAGAPDAAETRLQLWPEHFDLSVDLGDESAGRRGTFGASPGDKAHPLPYLYVTHWSDVPDDAFWNDAAFNGASLGYATLVTAAAQRRDALAFFGRGFTQLQRA